MRLRSIYVLAFCCVLLISQLHAQRSRVDSLLRVLKQTTLPNEQIEIYGYLGEAYYNFSPDTALQKFEQGLIVAKQIPVEKQDSNFWHSKSVLLNNAAFILQRKGDLYRAVLRYNECVELNKQVHDNGGEATAYLNLGSLYTLLKEYDLALDFLKKAQKVASSYDPILQANCYMGMGTIYKIKQKPIEAKNQFFAALALYQKQDHTSGISKAFNKIGELYFDEKNDVVAQDYFSQSMEIATKDENYRTLSESLINLAHIDFKQDRMKEAEEKSLLALNYAQITGYPENIRAASSLLYELYKTQNRSADALAMHELYSKMQDSLQAQEALKIVIQEKLRGDYENKTAQTEALQKVKDTRQRFILYGCIIGFILLSILLFFVWRSYRVKKKANVEILAQRDIIQEKNKEILDSIHYAKRIQDALLPDTSLLNHFFADSFVLFQPRDIVSG
ncbi:MAG: tetratricopeptide repeat protein, partial [Bacteroidia bacterium]